MPRGGAAPDREPGKPPGRAGTGHPWPGPGCRSGLVPTWPLPEDDEGEDDGETGRAHRVGERDRRDGQERAARALITSARRVFPSPVCFS